MQSNTTNSSARLYSWYDDPSDPETYGEKCVWIFDHFDGFFGLWTVLIFLLPLILAIVTGCCTLCTFQSRIFYSFRLFCYAWPVWPGILLNVWAIPHYACDGIPFMYFPTDAYVALVASLIGLFFSYCEALVFCHNHRVLGYQQHDIVLSPTEAQEWFTALQSDVSKLSQHLLSVRSRLPVVVVKYSGCCYIKVQEFVGRYRPVYNAHTGRTEMEYTYAYETVNKYLIEEAIKFGVDRVEDCSDDFPSLPYLKSGQGVTIKLESELLIGDQVTTDKMDIWKEGFQRQLREKGEKYELDKVKYYNFRDSRYIDNVPKEVHVAEGGEKPWYLNACLVTILGLTCMMWLWALVARHSHEDIKVTIRKKFYATL